MNKILLATLDFPPKKGGVAAYLQNVANFFGNQISVVAPPEEGAAGFDSAQNFKVHREPLLFRFFWPRHLRAFFAVKEIYKKEKAKILAINDVLPLGYSAFLLNKLFGVPYFVFLHGLDFNLAKRNCWKKFWLGKILKSAYFIVVNSGYLKREVERLISGEKIAIVYPSVGGFSAPDPGLKNEIINKYGLSGKMIIFSLGRLVRRKGFDKLISAFDEIRKETQNAVLLIAGSGPEEKALKNSAKGQKSIIFLGKISDEEKIALYDLCDVFAMTPRDSGGDIEGFGIVYLEAAAFGKPSVAGRVGGVSEAVLNGETGILVCGENADEIAEAIIKLLKDDNLRREMGEMAKERAVQEFSLERQVSKIENEIQRLV